MSVLWKDLISGQFETIAFRDEWVRVSRRTGSCLTCHSNNHGCLNHVSGDKSLCAREESDKPRKTNPPTWLHYHNGTGNFVSSFTQIDLEEEAEYRASRQDHNRVYTWMLERFPLSKRHKTELNKAGLKDLSDYGTLVQTDYNVEKLPFTIDGGVPGVFKNKFREEFYLKTSVTGWYRIVRDAEGYAMGAEIKLDTRSLKKQGLEGKAYQPITSAGKPGGIGADVLQYYVCHGTKGRKRAYVTEGGKKAQVNAEHRGFTTIGLRGVGNYRTFLADLATQFGDVEEFVVAVDMDFKTNTAVNAHRENLIEGIRNAGPFKVLTEEWSEEQKGLDDAILSNLPMTITEVHQARKVLTLEESYRVVGPKAKEVLSSGKIGLHLFEITVGAGKTYSFIQAVNEMVSKNEWFQFDGRRARVLWLVDDNYALLEETEKQFIRKPARLEGRTAKEDSPFFCANKEEVDQAASNGHNVMKAVCIGCPIKDFCPYLSKTKKVMENEEFVIAVKSSFLNESNRLEEFDIIIVDESLTDHVFSSTKIKSSDIKMHLQIINEARRHPHLQERSYQDSVDEYERVLNELLIGLELNEDTKDEVELIIAPPKMKPRYMYHKMFADYIKVAYGYPLNFLDLLLSGGMMHTYQGEIILDCVRFNLVEKLREKLVINLDATPSKTKLRVFGEFEHHQYTIEEHMNLFQLSKMRGSKRQLENPETGYRFLSAVEAIATQDRSAKTVVLSTKGFSKKMELFANRQDFIIDVGWYGNHTRGFNKFSNADNLVIVGNYCRNLSFMRMQHTLLKKVGINVSLEDLVEEDSINEMIQAIGRGRATRRKQNPINVFLLTNRELPSLYKTTSIPSLETLSGLAERDQQSGNKAKSSQASEKVREHVKGLLEKGFSVPVIPRALVSEATGVSRQTVKKVLSEIYFEQLMRMATEETSKDDLIAFADSMTPLNVAHAKSLKLNLTCVTTSVLDNYSPDALADVISRYEDLKSYLTINHPPEVQISKWCAFVDALSENIELERTHSNLGSAAGISRQLVSKYISLAGPIVNAYLEDFNDHDYKNDDVNKWKCGSHTRTLTLFASHFSSLTEKEFSFRGDIYEMVSEIRKIHKDVIDLDEFAQEMFGYGINMHSDAQAFEFAWKQLHIMYKRYVNYVNRKLSNPQQMQLELQGDIGSHVHVLDRRGSEVLN